MARNFLRELRQRTKKARDTNRASSEKAEAEYAASLATYEVWAQAEARTITDGLSALLNEAAEKGDNKAVVYDKLLVDQEYPFFRVHGNPPRTYTVDVAQLRGIARAVYLHCKKTGLKPEVFFWHKSDGWRDVTHLCIRVHW
jgi:hypothetical protein